MKKTTTLQLLSLFLIILIASGCGSNRHFGSRKYTSGNYVSHKHKAGNVKVNETTKEDATIIGEDLTALKTEKAPEVKPDTSASEATVLAGDETAMSLAPAKISTSRHGATAPKENTVSKARKQAALFKERYAINRYMFNRDSKCQAYADDSDNSLDPTALISFILSVVGVAINIIAISVIVATAEYILALLFIVGMVLGIVGLVLGTQGLRNHRKEKGATINLVFSIIGTALGGVAILTAFIFAFYTLIFFLSGI